MKQLLFWACLFSSFFISCNDSTTSKTDVTKDTIKNTSAAPANDNVAASSTDNVISFKVNGELVTSSGWTIGKSKMNGKDLINITSDMHKQPKTILINVNGNSEGTYKLASGMDALTKQGIAYGSYKPNYDDLSNDYSFEDGEIVITSIDNNKKLLNATFSGTVKNSKGESFSITDGKVINGKMH